MKVSYLSERAPSVSERHHHKGILRQKEIVWRNSEQRLDEGKVVEEPDNGATF